MMALSILLVEYSMIIKTLVWTGLIYLCLIYSDTHKEPAKGENGRSV